ncbi:MAG: hypothetical protein AAFQ07_12560 [Chloroflexota bacterium]
MHVVLNRQTHQLRWLDEEKTILQLDIHPGWTWDDGQKVLEQINPQIGLVEHDVYMVYNFSYKAQILSRNLSLSNLKSYLEKDMPNERQIYIIGADSILATLIRTLAGLYSYITENAGKVRFMDSVEDAYAHISDMKADLVTP